MVEKELTVLTEAMRAAGARALELARRGFEVQTKRDKSPVTTADLEVNRMLQEMHRIHFPDDGWLSEESPDNETRLTKPRVWIVDPIDGTKAFVNRLPEFCISVALIEHTQPILGAIYNPSTDELFTAVRGRGLRVNGRVCVPEAPSDGAPLVSVSPWEFRNGRWAGLDGQVQCRPMLSIANALALVSAGRMQASLTVEPENEWDLAAGVLLIEEGGGTVADGKGQGFSFNQPTPRFRGVIAVSATAPPGLRPLLQDHADRIAGTRKVS